MKVCRSKCRTVDEELEYIEECIAKAGNFFAFEVHPNIVRADRILRERLSKRRMQLLSSPEFKER